MLDVFWFVLWKDHGLTTWKLSRALICEEICAHRWAGIQLTQRSWTLHRGHKCIHKRGNEMQSHSLHLLLCTSPMNTCLLKTSYIGKGKLSLIMIDFFHTLTVSCMGTVASLFSQWIFKEELVYCTNGLKLYLLRKTWINCFFEWKILVS